MVYKYRVHVSDDNLYPVEVVQKILIPRSISSDDDLENACLEWADFQRFEHPGQAIDYYDTEGGMPDLSIVDLNYTELETENIPEKFRSK